mgnify:CR=1 FL=1
MKNILFVFLNILFVANVFSQQDNVLQLPTSIDENGGNPDASAILDVQSTDQGVLFPRMDLATIMSIPNPATGLMVYDIEALCLRIYDGSSWECLSTGLSRPGPSPVSSISGESYSGTGCEEANDIEVDAVGNYYIGGKFNTTTNFANITINPQPGIPGGAIGYNGYLAKFGPTGNAIWVRNFASNNDVEVFSIFVDNPGNVFVTGAFSGPSVFGTTPITPTGPRDLFVLKLNSTGTFQWIQTASVSGAGASAVTGQEIVVDNLGRVTVAGTFAGTVNFGGGVTETSLGGDDIFLVQYNSVGALQWLKKAGGAGNEVLGGLDYSSANDLHIAGSFTNDLTFTGSATVYSTMGAEDGFAAKYDSNGNVLWTRQIGAVGDQSVNSLDVDASDDVLYAGTFTNTVLFNTTSLTAVGSNIFLLKYNAAGSQVYVENIGGMGNENAVDIISNSSNDIYILGEVTSSTQFGGVSFPITNDNLALIKYTNNAYDWAVVEGGNANLDPTALDINSNNDILTTGMFKQLSAQFGSITLQNDGTCNEDIYVAEIIE